jgi:regulator of CtrA degradation
MSQSINFENAAPVSFAERLASSDAFKSMFREGMTLVEEAAAYLDGPGREQAKCLARAESLAYAAESMRLTTRLMQLASWLLLQRAVNEGELTLDQAAMEKRKVKLSQQDSAAAPDIFARLPETLRDLVCESLRLQARIIHLDQLLYLDPNAPLAAPVASPVEDQLARLRAAFG